MSRKRRIRAAIGRRLAPAASPRKRAFPAIRDWSARLRDAVTVAPLAPDFPTGPLTLAAINVSTPARGERRAPRFDV
ncbi:hypothetical protein BKD09_01810 [Bradyrhizobium japonicum]|uniref:Uncharacterized protein n=1 Tax=Bradyrhizobium japonicum TaxID=375 RepID=A0A1L3F1B3_BRAJP|nr:hypothetical protein BKD09_01810 [Bradyrhizobium japonicum]